MSDFITDVERQYEMYCKIAEEHGFIDLNAKKNGFRCTTKSNEFNAGWIAFTGAVAAVRDEQQAKIEKLEIELSTTKQVLGNVIDMEVAKVDNLKAQLNNMEACYVEKKKELEDQQSKIDELNQHIKRLESKLDSLGADRQELVGQVNDLQKQNAWLSDVAERENNRANNLQQDKTSTTILLGKTIQEKNKLQKRINEALVCVDQAKDGFYGFSCDGGDTDNLAKHLEKALRGASD